MRLLIIGSRDAPDEVLAAVRALVLDLPAGTTVISGCRPDTEGSDGGAVDRTAIAAAKERGDLLWEAYPASWERHGKAAGPLRTEEMIRGPWQDWRIFHKHRDFKCRIRVRRFEDLVIHSAAPIREHYPGLLPHWGALRGRLKLEGALLEEGRVAPPPDRVAAFWDGRSKGTRYGVELCRSRDIPVDVLWPVRGLFNQEPGRTSHAR